MSSKIAELEHAILDIEADIETQKLNLRCFRSEIAAREEHGDDLVDQACCAAKKSGTIYIFHKESDPYNALLQWYRETKTSKH